MSAARCDVVRAAGRCAMSRGRVYLGGALMSSASRAVSIVAGALALAVLFALYLWAVSLGLPNL